MRKQVLGFLGVAALGVLVLSLMANVLLSGMLFGKKADFVQEPDRFQQLLVVVRFNEDPVQSAQPLGHAAGHESRI